MLTFILKKPNGRIWTGLIGVRIESVAGSCKHGNEPSDIITEEGFLDKLNTYKLLKKDSALWN
jgi:hypothetical protein